MVTARRLAALLLAASALSLAACGSDATEPESGGTGTTSTEETPLQDGTSVDPADGTDAPEGSPYGDTTENGSESNR